MNGGLDLAHLEATKFYLFGDVKFLHLLILLMALDILTGVFKAIKNKNLWSRKSTFGYAKKVLVLVVIVVANVVDQILGLDGAVTYSTVIFYIVVEGWSILENVAELEVLVPASLADKMELINRKRKSAIREIIDEEFDTSVKKDHKDDEGSNQ